MSQSDGWSVSRIVEYVEARARLHDPSYNMSCTMAGWSRVNRRAWWEGATVAQRRKMGMPAR